MSQLTTAISGSFKFKGEIDALHEEFADHGVTVLEPERGWLYIPSRVGLTQPLGFRPLPGERHMSSPREIEQRFLDTIRRVDFLYLFNPEQYLGLSASMEVGFALAIPKPVFAKEPISPVNVDYDLDKYSFLSEVIKVATPVEAAELIRQDAK